jgi:carbonic anhydrase
VISALEALQRLREGNDRFVAGVRTPGTFISKMKRREFMASQQPFAIILGCSDSRAPVEIIFDQGLGDLFVVRVAGNIAGPSQIGSIEFAVERFGTRLVVVLGHTRCGAVQATLESIFNPGESPSPGLRSIIEQISPSVEEPGRADGAHDNEDLAARAVRANIRASVNNLRRGSQVLEQLILSDGLLICGAEFSLETGKVDFFEGLSEPG